MLEFARIFPLLETMNSIACGIMLSYMLVISITMPGRGMWGRRLIVWALSTALAIQIISPWAGWVPKIVWHGALLHSALALALVIWRKEAFLFINCKFAPPETQPPHEMRRATDWAALDGEST